MPSSPLRVAVVCMSNMNRSMEAHGILRKKGFRVRSFGAGSHVRLPGPARNLPVVYDFSTTYEQMRKDLLHKDGDRYRSNGILHILGRNERIKPHPERFQECRDPFDVIFTCQESVYDRVVEDLCTREQETCQPVHVINVDMEDTLEDATLGALIICELCQRLQQADDLEDHLAQLLLAMEEKTGRSFLHTVCFY
ncbi:RNA polymerase II subunit A C-terminal domain phosphatase SSU72 like protein 3-like [Hippopotamus amphibius kiboko]|uniref:RNA polymerase II subunit A C-terminal domain phosphatase SSU72 like protein 3-like n=1 Tax=Hippopotamus amphibius kiboko TaxID=575201 RepID=UPI002592C3B3|nr:RNA polymerase II subunit A C-terminal domain phosphatase SSU72 like protein 3-like [Hippopotamus amphibius kiboko]